MPQFYAAHTLSIEQNFSIPYKFIQKGMILKFKYAPIDEGSKLYMMIVLNSYWKGKLHGLTLNNFSPFILNKMAEDLGVSYSRNVQNLMTINIPHLIMEQSSNRFYHKDIKPYIEQTGKLNYSYRTMFKNKIQGLTAVNYKFNTKVMKLLEGKAI